MLTSIQIIIFIFALFALSRAMLRWRERAISVFEFLFWTSVWSVLLLLVFMPDATTIISRMWGVGRGIDSVLYVSIIALFYLVFRLYVKLESQQQDFTKLVRYQTIRDAGTHQEHGTHHTLQADKKSRLMHNERRKSAACRHGRGKM